MPWLSPLRGDGDLSHRASGTHTETTMSMRAFVNTTAGAVSLSQGHSTNDFVKSAALHQFLGGHRGIGCRWRCSSLTPAWTSSLHGALIAGVRDPALDKNVGTGDRSGVVKERADKLISLKYTDR